MKILNKVTITSDNRKVSVDDILKLSGIALSKSKNNTKLFLDTEQVYVVINNNSKYVYGWSVSWEEEVE